MKEQIFIISCEATNLSTPQMYITFSEPLQLLWIEIILLPKCMKKIQWNMARKMLYQRIKTIHLFPVERSLLACLFLQYLNHILFITSSTAQDCLLITFWNSHFCNSLAKSLTHFSTSGSFIALINVAVVINSKILKNRDLFYSLNRKDVS